MKKGKGFSFDLPLFFLILALAVAAVPAVGQEAEINRSKIFGEYYQLITDTDLYCSIFLYEEGKPFPNIRIIGAERENEKNHYADNDTVYIDKGKADGIEIGQVFLIVNIGEKVGKYGKVMQRLSRAKVVRIDGDHMSTIRLERSCGGAQVGDSLIPFEEMEGEIGKDQGYANVEPGVGVSGNVFYIENDFQMAGSGQWALVNVGRRQCVQIGDRLTVFHAARPNLPREAVSSAIVIDVRGGSATIKILSARDAVSVGDQVQVSSVR